jgi:hypothetical protein
MFGHGCRIESKSPDRQGFALVTTLLIVLVLAVLALGVAYLASSEKKVSFAEEVHVRSVLSADAGGEAGINFLRMSTSPPKIIDFGNNRVVSVGETPIAGSQTYEYDAFFIGKSLRPGWGTDFLDYDYRITSEGAASRTGQSEVHVIAGRLFKEGY